MKHVVFVAIPPVQILDLTGPFEVFARAGGYRVSLVTSARGGLVSASCGLVVAQAAHYTSLREERIDTLVIPGGEGAEEGQWEAGFPAWLAKKALVTRRVASVCTGAFALAAAGLLEQRRAVTHWRYCDALSRAFPKIRVERDPIYIKDGSVYTTAGVTAGIDLALALVEEDQGKRRALEIARDLVMFLKRPGGQSQFAGLLESQTTMRDEIGDLRSWMMGRLQGDLRVSVLARHCRMSARQFARVFVEERGITPARYVEQIRVEAARVLLENGRYPLKVAAQRCGFGSADTMRRSFLRVLGVAPSQYAQRFPAR